MIYLQETRSDLSHYGESSSLINQKSYITSEFDQSCKPCLLQKSGILAKLAIRFLATTLFDLLPIYLRFDRIPLALFRSVSGKV